jgi:hypothetical protein
MRVSPPGLFPPPPALSPSQLPVTCFATKAQFMSRATDEGVVQAALACELAQRDGALMRYEKLKGEYEIARLRQARRRRLASSHAETLLQLRELVRSVQALLNTCAAMKMRATVPDTLVTAVRLLLSSKASEEVDKKMLVTLSRYSSFSRMSVLTRECRGGSSSVSVDGIPHNSAVPVAVSSTSSSVCGEGSRSPLPSLALGPLLLWSHAGLSYRCHLLDTRRRLASELARAGCRHAASLRKSQQTGSALESDNTTETQQNAVETARAELKRAKDFQRCVKQRLYEVHQLLIRARHASCVDARGCFHSEAATEAYRQIQEELQRGRVTLLRILCESGMPPLW